MHLDRDRAENGIQAGDELAQVLDGGWGVSSRAAAVDQRHVAVDDGDMHRVQHALCPRQQMLQNWPCSSRPLQIPKTYVPRCCLSSVLGGCKLAHACDIFKQHAGKG